MKDLLFYSVAFLLLGATRPQAATVSVTTVADPPEAGRITGGGEYAPGKMIRLQFEANRGWFLTNIAYVELSNLLSHRPQTIDPQESFRRELFFREIEATNDGKEPDLTTVTNFLMDTFEVRGDCTITASFASLAPWIKRQPTNQIVVAGSGVEMTAAADGGKPISYQWLHDDKPLSGETHSNLVLNSTELESAGAYVLVASNAFGAVSSHPANLEVRQILMLVNGKPVTNSVVETAFVLSIELKSMFQGGSIFYTLDGSDPDTNPLKYSAPFLVSKEVTIRALAKNSDQTQSIEVDPVKIITVPAYDLEVVRPSFGTITLDPPDGPYASNSIVTLVATPREGWQFMGWHDDLSGADPTNTIRMTGPKRVQGRFGTTVKVTTIGNGTVRFVPDLPVYPAGIDLEIWAVPAPGHRVLTWKGGPIGGVGASLSYQFVGVYDANPELTVEFVPLSLTEATLNASVEGGGFLEFWKRNVSYKIGETNMLTATPAQGQRFLGWKGDASGTNNPLPVVLDSSKSIIASFTSDFALLLEPNGRFRIPAEGFYGHIYGIEGTDDLQRWSPVMTITNYERFYYFSDPEGFSKPRRLYRAVAQ